MTASANELSPISGAGTRIPAASDSTLGKLAVGSTQSNAPRQPSLNHCASIYQHVCQPRGLTRDPTGYIHSDLDGEKKAREIYKSIILKHPDWTPEQVDEELVHTVYDPRNRARIISAFHWVRQKMEKFIDAQPEDVLTPLEKFHLKFRIQKTKLLLPPPASLYADEPDILLRSEVFYERMLDGKMDLRVGGAYLFVAKSWFNLVFTMAHELAHSIDPCEVRSVRMSLPAYDQLEACFLQNQVITHSRFRDKCGNNDQLSEAFADWVAVQVTVEALKLYSTEFDHNQILRSARNAVRDLCEQEDEEPETESHPSPHTRIETIFGQNPALRQLLGCEPIRPPMEYCHFESTSPSKTKNTIPRSPSP